MDLLIYIRMIGLATATGIGIWRLYRNYLRRYEKYVYILATITTIWFFVADLLVLYRRIFGVPALTTTHGIYRMGWPLLITTLILFMLYYRRIPKV